MNKFKANINSSDSIMILLEKNLKEFECVDSYIENFNSCKIKTKEGIEYNCYLKQDKNVKVYYLYNSCYEKKCKLGNKTIECKYFNENIVPEIFKNNILRNEIMYKAFKEGIKAFRERNTDYDVSLVLGYNKYLEYSKNNNLEYLIYYIWNKGYEFATKFPDPNIVYEQYQFLKDKTLEKIDINTIRRFMLQNENIYIYLDEKPVPEKAKELKNVKEIEYSYGHIVARAKTYDLKMNILPLDGEILVFDTEGVNEIAKCNVDYYSIEYENKAIYKMFQSEKNFELESYIEEEKKENENNEQEE